MADLAATADPATRAETSADERSQARLAAALAIVDASEDSEVTILKLRDFIGADHLVYHSSKLGSRPSSDPYIRLTYPASWIKRYLQMGYIDVDPVLREGFSRTLPFDWSEVAVASEREGAFLMDALAHGVGPFGLSIPVRNKKGHRALFSVSCSGTPESWAAFKAANLALLVAIANRLHRRLVAEVFGDDHPQLSAREIECLQWTAVGKDAGEIADILELSAHTVRDYLKSARFKLDCVTSAQAVTKAVKLGLFVL